MAELSIIPAHPIPATVPYINPDTLMHYLHSFSWPHQIPRQRLLKLLHPDGHLERVKGILHHEIRIDLVAPAHHDLRIRLLGARKQQELDTCGCLETRQAEVTALQAFNAGGGGFAVAGEVRGEWGGGDGAADGVDAVEGAGEDEVVVAVEFLEAGGEGAVED